MYCGIVAKPLNSLGMPHLIELDLDMTQEEAMKHITVNYSHIQHVCFNTPSKSIDLQRTKEWVAGNDYTLRIG